MLLECPHIFGSTHMIIWICIYIYVHINIHYINLQKIIYIYIHMCCTCVVSLLSYQLVCISSIIVVHSSVVPWRIILALQGHHIICRSHGLKICLRINAQKKTMNTSGPHSHPSRYFSLDSQKIVRKQSWIFLRTLGIFVCSKAWQNQKDTAQHCMTTTQDDHSHDSTGVLLDFVHHNVTAQIGSGKHLIFLGGGYQVVFLCIRVCIYIYHI